MYWRLTRRKDASQLLTLTTERISRHPISIILKSAGTNLNIDAWTNQNITYSLMPQF